MELVGGHFFGEVVFDAFNRLLVGLGLGDEVIERADKIFLRKSLGQGLIVEKETEDDKRENQEPKTDQAEKKIINIQIGHNNLNCTRGGER